MSLLECLWQAHFEQNMAWSDVKEENFKQCSCLSSCPSPQWAWVGLGEVAGWWIFMESLASSQSPWPGTWRTPTTGTAELDSVSVRIRWQIFCWFRLSPLPFFSKYTILIPKISLYSAVFLYQIWGEHNCHSKTVRPSGSRGNYSIKVSGNNTSIMQSMQFCICWGSHFEETGENLPLFKKAK